MAKRLIEFRFLSTLSLRRATLIEFRKLLHPSHFYPRSPCGERRQQPHGTTRTTYFYPRSPCGERLFWFGLGARVSYFYPRSPCGERRNGYPHTRQRDVISIHALLAESDLLNGRFRAINNTFLSTLSLRRATMRHNRLKPRQTNFYPRSPCGERLTIIITCIASKKFLSTLSLRRAT